MTQTRPNHGGNLRWAAQVARCSPDDILDFSASINPLGPPASAIAAIQQQLSSITAYPDPDYVDLRQAIAAVHDLEPDWIMPGNGAAELLTWAARDMATYAATLLPTPAFRDYGRALRGVGATLTPCPLREFSAGGLATAIATTVEQLPVPLAQCALLVNNPHNPTGVLLARDLLVSWLDQFGLVVLDEAFMDFLPPAQQQSCDRWVADYPNLVILRSLTKFYSIPGLRIGYAIAQPDRLHRWQDWRDPWSVNRLAEVATLAALQDHAFQQRTWDWLAPARSQLAEALDQLPGWRPFPGAANFLLVQSDHAIPPIQRQLLERDRILIRDCLSFPELGDRYARIAVKTPADHQRLLAGLQAILT